LNDTLKAFLLFTLKYLKPFKKSFFLGLFFALLASLLTGLGTSAIKPAFNIIFVQGRHEYFWLIPMGIVLLFGFIGLSSLLQAYYMKITTTGMVNLIRLTLFQKCLNLPYELLAKERTGQTVSRVINDTAQIEPVLAESFQILIKEGLTVLVLIGVAFYMRFDLTLLVLVTLPIIVYTSKHLGAKTRLARRQTQLATGELTHRLTEALRGIKELKLFPSQELVFNLFEKELKRAFRYAVKITKYREASKSIVDLMNGIGGALVISYGGYLIIKGSLDPGSFLSVLTAILLVYNPVRKLARAYTGLKEAQGAWSRIDEVLSLPEEKAEGKKPSPPQRSFELRNVSFRYDEALPLALCEVSTNIPARKMVALVGPSGSGKTTLIHLLIRFYQPTSGEIFLDGEDINNFNLREYRNLFGVVLQEPFLFNLSILDNLLLAKPTATFEEVVSACELARAHEFILNLPKGYHTVLGEEGINLSGGERQRLALARIFLRKPPIIILDEATSQLDALTEVAIESALERLRGEATIIVIAHRLSTIIKADKIILLDRGKVVAEGTHDELLKAEKLYQNLYQSFMRQEV
jgi:subfamily B ATP-binding cassette protein MsbA